VTKNDTYRGQMTVDEIEDAAWKSIRFGAGDHIRDMPRMLSFVDGFVAGDAHGYQRAVSGAPEERRLAKNKAYQDAGYNLGFNAARLSCAKEIEVLKECLAESRQGYEQRIAELERENAGQKSALSHCGWQDNEIEELSNRITKFETLVEMVLAHGESQQWLEDAQKLARELK